MAKKATATRVTCVLAGIEFKVFISIFFKGFELEAAKCFAHQHDVKVIGGFGPCKGFPSIRRKKPVIGQYFLQIGRKGLRFNGKRRRLVEKFFGGLLGISVLGVVGEVY
jgi:hypothetical protein